MNKKSLSVFGLGILALLTLMSFASAVTTTISFPNGMPTLSQPTAQSTPTQVPITGGSFTITILDTANETVTFSATPIPDINGKTITFTSPSPLVITDAPTPHTVTISYTVDSNFAFEVGKPYTTSLTVTGSVNGPATLQTLSFASTNEPSGVSSCKLKAGANIDKTLGQLNDNLGVSIDSTKVITGFGSDQTWYPLDNIQTKVTVDNNGHNDLRNIVLNWALYDITKQQIVSNLHDKLSSFSLNSGDSKILTINFKLDPTNRLKTDKYMIYVWATATDKDTSSTTCTSTNNVDNIRSNLGSLVINVDPDLVVLDNLQTISTVSCGNNVQISGTVWNIGDNNEDNVYIKVFNTELGISQKVLVGSIDSLSSKDISFNVAIPTNAQSGQSYDITFQVFKGDNVIFQSQNSNNDKSQAILTLPVTGTCTNLPKALITANLQNTPKAGQEFTVLATVSNTDTKANTFNVALNGYNSWASLVSVDKTALNLNAGQSQDVTIVLKANTGISGDQTFNLVLTQGTQTLTQPVSVPIQASTSSITGLFSGLGGNAYLWGIAALNILLVLIIIVVAVRVVRKK